MDKYSKGVVDAASVFLDARQLYDVVDQETEKVDPDFRNHTAERYHSFADISLSERMSEREEAVVSSKENVGLDLLLDGEIIPLDPRGGCVFNPLNGCANDAEEDPITSNVDLIVALCEATKGPDFTLLPSQISLLEQCLKRLYEPYFDSQNKQTAVYDQTKIPTLRDLYNLVRAQAGFDAYLLAMTLEEVLPDTLFSTDVEVAKNEKISTPGTAGISNERAVTLFWWWSIDMANGCKGKWRDTLTPEEQALLAFWDSTKQK